MSPTRVLVVDDSVVVRRLVTQALEQDQGVEVVGSAANGRIALHKVEQLRPDLVTMDVEMPEMDGIDTVRALRKAGYRMPIVMFSTLTERGAAATMDALTAGASDYVTKPTGTRSVEESLQRVAEELLPKVHTLVPRRVATARAAAEAQRPPARRGSAVRLAERAAPPRPVRAVLVGSSTGGPAALAAVVGGLSTPLPVPVVVVQHMPPVFTRQLADRLDRLGPATVLEAGNGQQLRPGHVYVAPGGRHLEVAVDKGLLCARLTDAPPVNYCRPSADVLFRSAVRALGGDLLAVVLTGMGADGLVGAGEVLGAGGGVVVQDEETSVVWGMPGAVATAGYAHHVVPLGDVTGTVQRMVGGAA